MGRKQDNLTGQLWAEPPEMREGPVARVAMLAAVEGQYTYAVPEELLDRVQPGMRVLVPFGKAREAQPAFCVSVGREPWTNTLRKIVGVVDEVCLLDERLLELGQWMARYYGAPLGRTLGAMVPEAVRRRSGFVNRRTVSLSPGQSPTPSPGTAPTPSKACRTRSDAGPFSPKQKSVLQALADRPDGMELHELLTGCGVGKGVIDKLVQAGIVEIQAQRIPAPAPNFDHPGPEPAFELNPSQRAAIEQINHLSEQGHFKVVLLFGVSGSGKTEVYIHAIRAVLARGRQAILLVPEIALTTQLVDRLASRFTDVAVIHSGLTGVQRSLQAAAIARGEKRIIIGTRSAVFSPCPDLGLIVVDEEQEPSYKNQQSPRFNTRDVAVKRAQMASIPVVLGSATPSLESWHNCERYRHFVRITLPSRVAGLPMPKVEFVDMQLEQRQRGGLHLLSRMMEVQLAETLAAGQQAVLLLNRRGYASYLVCSRCRTPIVCPNCRVNMTYHQSIGKAVCHHCAAKLVVPKKCGDPACGGTIIRWGMGTQRVQEELSVKFPDTRVARADSDTMLKTEDYARLVQQFAGRQIDVLVGTQMIAKGLDFPAVSFVGVVNADTSAGQTDFRRNERTFQMVTQVAGRAGRADVPGRVVVQSWSGSSRALQFAANHDFESFARFELPERKAERWPPFSRIARFLCSDVNQAKALHKTRSLADRIRQHLVDTPLPAEVLGPQSSPMPRIRNRYRFEFLLRTANATDMLKTLESIRHDRLLKGITGLLVDVDPVDLL